MSRLRVRLELNRRSAGVPLDKLASVVEETRRFFHLLAEDVKIEAEHAEWVASDFDPEALNFTAEYSGSVTTEQARAFGAAFAGATSLRRATIAQFTRIADFLGEDELVGFGLFQADSETEPSEWRCLSKRDAQRFGQEIRLLAQAAGETHSETSLPAVMNGSVAGRRLFKDRREREALAADPAKMIREVESNLSRRIEVLEGEVAAHGRKIKEQRLIGPSSDAPDERFTRLLGAMEAFCAAQPPRQMQLLEAPAPVETPASPPTPEVVAAEPAPAPVEEAAPMPEKPADPTLEKTVELKPPARRSRKWPVAGMGIAAALIIGVAIPQVQRRYSAIEAMPVFHPKTPAAPEALQVAAKPEKMQPQKQAPKSEVHSITKPLQRFEGPQIALAIPADFRAKIPTEARVQVIVAIDDQGNVTEAQVASAKGKGAQLLANEALAAAKRARFHPAREGDRPVESQMVLTYLFKPDSTEF
jgi:TonB family protein